jgi:protein-tyrosine phosphatase
MPVRDFGVPPASQVVETLDAIDAELARGGLVFLHCWGGCGRTGTIASCWLVRHGLDGAAALARYGELSRVVCGRRCPETDEQRALVLGWSAGR